MRNRSRRAVWRAAAVVWLLLMLAASCFSQEESARQSGWVWRLVQSVAAWFSPEAAVPVWVVRKAAHAAEYAVWGVLLCGAFDAGRRRPRRFMAPALLCILAGPVCDETVQIFSQRGASLADVWLDAAFAAAAFAAAALIRRAVRKHKQNGGNTDGIKG
ncbi:MAG: VanZ family protein [Clostridia bacterium]|nr:VanZ family protein [Clostridia bacterium]